jgi:tetratricopeptide (TPR) repeat protein
LNPDYALSLINSSVIYIQNNEPQKAIDQLTHALSVSTEYPTAYDYRAQAYFLLGKYTDAIADWQSLLHAQPETAATYDWIGRSYIALKQFNDALSALDKGIALDSTLADLYYQKGLAYVEMKEFEKSLPLLQKAIDAGVDVDLAYYNCQLFQTGRCDQHHPGSCQCCQEDPEQSGCENPDEIISDK